MVWQATAVKHQAVLFACPHPDQFPHPRSSSLQSKVPQGFSAESVPVYACAVQGEALIKKLIALDDWEHIYAVARQKLPHHSKKITQISLDLNKKEVTHLLHLAHSRNASTSKP